VSTDLVVDADLRFSVEVDGHMMTGTLQGSGSELELTVDDPRLLGGSGTATARAVADELAAHGVRLTVTADRPLVTLGTERSGFLQRRVTGSSHISVASLVAALRILTLRSSRAATPLVPPPTPLPLLPTVLRRPRRPTTTHDPDGGGYPRLVMAPDPHPRPGDVQPVFHLGSLSVLGSDPGADIVLPGLSARHAEVRHTADDEFEITSLDPARPVRVNGAPAYSPQLLRTGTRVDAEGWTLSFYREEWADHGRPYGGRVGGEIGHQRLQPDRDELRRRRRS
jgi:hypothetical protein